MGKKFTAHLPLAQQVPGEEREDSYKSFASFVSFVVLLAEGGLARLG